MVERTASQESLQTGSYFSLPRVYTDALRDVLDAMTDEPPQASVDPSQGWQQVSGLVTRMDGDDKRWLRDRRFRSTDGNDAVRIQIWHDMPAPFRRPDQWQRGAADDCIEITQSTNRYQKRCVVYLAGSAALYQTGEVGSKIIDQTDPAATADFISGAFAKYFGKTLPRVETADELETSRSTVVEKAKSWLGLWAVRPRILSRRTPALVDR